MSTSTCVRRSVCIGSCFWVCWVCAQVRMGLGGSGQSRGPGCVCVLPERTVNVLSQNWWIRPGPPLGGGRAGGGGPLGQVFPVPGTASLSLAFPIPSSPAPGRGEEATGPSGWNSHK